MVRISYNKLWKMLIDKEMQKRDLQEAAGISSASIAKLGKSENITTDILIKICEALNCDLNDIMETKRDQVHPPSNYSNVEFKVENDNIKVRALYGKCAFK